MPYKLRGDESKKQLIRLNAQLRAALIEERTRVQAAADETKVWRTRWEGMCEALDRRTIERDQLVDENQRLLRKVHTLKTKLESSDGS